jgi:DNA-binding PadR family transcriptional regulator
MQNCKHVKRRLAKICWVTIPQQAAGMIETSPLGTFELMVLLAALQCDEGAYGTPIRRQIETWTGRPVSRGAVYATLDRLEEKGLLRSTLGDPTPERGGRAKRFYRVAGDGLEAVRASRRALVEAWTEVEALLDEV